MNTAPGSPQSYRSHKTSRLDRLGLALRPIVATLRADGRRIAHALRVWGLCVATGLRACGAGGRAALEGRHAGTHAAARHRHPHTALQAMLSLSACFSLCVMLALSFTPEARAGLRGNPMASPGAANGEAARAAAAAEQQAKVERAQSALARTTMAIQAMQSAQAAARAAALAAASNVPNGLTPGGLQPTSNSGPDWWLNADAPVQSAVEGGTLVTVKQTAEKAILTWDSFNIGKETTLYFDQTAGGADASQWVALNRVTDIAPSQILGGIKAEGQVYVINTNGILFGGSSQVNVNTLLASSLDFRGATLAVRNETFQQGIAFDDARLYVFGADGGTADYAPDDGVFVEAGAQIASTGEGAVYLIGHNVANDGTITAPDGQVVLAAGGRVWITKNWLSGHDENYTDPDLRGVRAVVQLGGTATNTGLISSDRGNITVTGSSIRNDGVLAATTSSKANGSITLLAGDGAANDTIYWVWPTVFGSITLGEGSLLAITPDDSAGTAMSSQYRASKIDLFGQTILMEEDARIYAPGATTTFVAKTHDASATAETDPSFIYLAEGSEIWLAGLQEAEVAMERNSVEGELRLDELKDAPLLRDGPLRGKKVTVDLRRGTTLADLSGYYGLIEYGVEELMTSGGSLKLDSGTIVTREGSTIDLSGGSLRYLDGYVTSTRLLGADGHVYDISNASPNILYTGIYDTYRRFEQGYLEGKNAGSLIIGPQVGRSNVSEAANTWGSGNRPYFTTFDGTLRAGTTVGAYQTNRYTGSTSPQTAWREVPRAASLTIGYYQTSLNRYYGPHVTIGDFAPLPADFAPGSAFDSSLAHIAHLPSGWFDGGTFGTVSLISGAGGGNLVVEPGVVVDLGAFGSFSFLGSHALIEGSIVASGGSVSLQATLPEGTYWTSNAPILWDSLTDEERPWIRLGEDAAIDVSGLWINDRLAGSSTPGANAINGGSVSLQTVHDLILAPGSLIDVSGGGRLGLAGTVTAGNAGSITLQNDILPISTQGFGLPTGLFLPSGDFDVFGAELRGYALGTGGSLRLGMARSITITDNAPPASEAGALLLSPDFFQQNGFASYSLGATGDLVVTPGTVIETRALSYILGSAAWALPTGGDLGSVLTTGFLADDLRQPMSLTLSNWLRQPTGGTIATSAIMPAYGAITVGEGAQILLDPGSSLSLYAMIGLAVDGTLSTPGGAITLGTTQGTLTLGEQARLLAPGYTRTTWDANGTAVRSVEAAGSVTLQALSVTNYVQAATLFTDPGSVIDVSGIVGVADLLRTGSGLGGGRATYVARTVGGDAGAVTLAGFNSGEVAGHILAAPGNASAAGGSLTIRAGHLSDLTRATLVLTDGEAAYSGSLVVRAGILRKSGADSLRFQAPGGIAFDGDLRLEARRLLAFDTPRLGLAPGSAADAEIGLLAPYVSFGAFPGMGANTATLPPAIPSAPPSLLGQLTVTAGLIDFYQTLDLGGNGWGGFAEARFVSSGDIRLTVSTATDLSGRLQSPGALVLESAQTYVTTPGQPRAATHQGFLIQSGQSVTFLGNGASAPVPYSFGETLTVIAPDIVQAGVLRAPLGKIDLQAANTLTLAPGSLTSVSLEGLVVPVGEATGGVIANWQTAASAPAKVIRLGGLDVDVQDGAVVDLSGGGDLYAYEFIAGNGGSADLLNTAGMFAILPGYYSAAAPVYASGGFSASGLSVGDSVYLSGVAGLADGVYTLLPAHYALLPGGLAIQALDSGFATASSGTVTTLDGSQIASGYRTVAGTTIRDADWTRFRVLTQEVVRQYSTYTDISYNDYITDLAAEAGIVTPRLPLDAGTLTLAATRSLTLDGTGRFGAPEGGLLGNVDIAALKIALLGDGQAAPDDSYLTLDPVAFSNFGIGSLLLGGSRSQTDAGTLVNVSATHIYVANDTDSALVLPELLLAAKDTITITDGSVLIAEGAVSADTAPLLFADSGTAANADNGALLRLSTGDRVGVSRAKTTTGSGRLLVGEGVTLSAAGSIILDGTQSVVAGATAILDAPQLDLSSSLVSIGDAPEGTGGLVLGAATVEALGASRSLLLRSYSTIDLYGSVSLGGLDGDGRPLLESLIFDAAGLRGFGDADDTVTITAQELALRNTFGVVATGSTAGTGALALDAGLLVLGSGASVLDGFSTVAITADQVTASGTGSLTTGAPLAVATDLLTAGKASDYQILSTGAVTITQGRGTAQTPAEAGGRLLVTGTDVVLDTLVNLPAGVFEARATTGDLVVGDHARLLAQGTATEFFDVVKTAPGGTLRLSADAGDVTVGGGAVLDVSGSPQGGAAGRIEVTATQGRATLAGALLGDAAEGHAGGSLALDAATLADWTGLNAALNAAGFDAERSVRLRDQAITLGAGETIAAHDVLLQSDTGRVTVDGSILANGTVADSDGGTVRLVGGDGVSLGGTARIEASALDNIGEDFPAQSGRVEITATGGSVGIAAGSVITATGGADGGGSVVVTAPRTADDLAVTELAGTVTARELIVRGERAWDYSGTGTVGTADYTAMLADAAAWMAHADAIHARLGNAQAEVQAGIRAFSDGDLTITNDLDLHTHRTGGAPGALTFAAGGDLRINGSISDGFSTALASTGTLLADRSWDLAFESGGDLTLAAGKLIRTGTGDITVRAGGDLVLTDTKSVIYTAGRRVDDEAGFVRGSRVGEYPVDGGDVTLAVGRDIVTPLTQDFITGWLYRYGYANTSGGLRLADMTVASQTSWSVVFANFEQGIGTLGGGNIDITAGRNIHDLAVVLPTTGQQTAAVGSPVLSGDVVVRGGGDLSIKAGGDIYGGVYMLGRGEAEIVADGSLTADRQSYQRRAITVSSTAVTNYVLKDIHALFALMDASLTVRARGDVEIEAIVDPAMVPLITANISGNGSRNAFFQSYTDRTAADVATVGGDLRYYNNMYAGADLARGNTARPINQQMSVPAAVNTGTVSITRDLLYAPGTLRFSALQGSIGLLLPSFHTNNTNHAFRLAPSATGTLELLAAETITSATPIVMMDVAPEYVRTAAAPFRNNQTSNFNLPTADVLGSATNYGRGTSPLHLGDSTPALIYVLDGSIIGTGGFRSSFSVTLPKSVQLRADEDLSHIVLHIQHNQADDLSIVQAGRDIRAVDLRVLGPGELWVEAGGDLTLKSSVISFNSGIRTTGNVGSLVGTSGGPSYATQFATTNLALKNEGAGITILAGLDGGVNYEAFAAAYLDPANASGVVRTYLPELRDYMEGLGYSGLDNGELVAAFAALSVKQRQPLLLDIYFTELKETGIDVNNPDSPRFGSYRRGFDAVETLFGEVEDGVSFGDINFYGRPVLTQSGGGISVLAPYGQILIDEVGNTASSNGVITRTGGAVRMMSHGDIALANSRVFTLQGGDLIMWTSEGDITAGAGSKTRAVAPALRYVLDNDANVLLNASALQTGSGIGVLDAARSGTIRSRLDLIAPQGTVDAGDAGIRAVGDLNIAALQVLGADNISVGGEATGVPVAAAPNVAAIAAAGDTAGALSSAAAETVQQQRNAAAPQELPAFYNIEVIGYGGDAEGTVGASMNPHGHFRPLALNR